MILQRSMSSINLFKNKGFSSDLAKLSDYKKELILREIVDGRMSRGTHKYL